MAELSLEAVSLNFGQEKVLDDVSLAVEDGQLAVILGPSGCGKSTLLRLVAGLERQDRGRVFIGGQEVSGLSPRQRDVAMVFQSYALYPHLSVADNLAFGLKVRRAPRPEIRRLVDEAAAMLGLEGLLQRKPRELSGGQRQRVAIGRAIVRRPRLFLFDEPLSNLDARLRGEMRLELNRLHRRLGTTMLYVTHDQVEAMTLGQRIVILAQGRVEQIGGPRDIYERPASLFVAGFIGSPPMNFLEARVAAGPRELVLRCPEANLELDPPPGFAAPEGLALTLGIRPEDLLPAPHGMLRAELEVMERLGPENLLHLRRRDVSLVAKVPPEFQASPGQILSLDIRPGRVHLFRDGRRWEPSP
ncbi:MAG: sn-glycerol-3-phosphate ABC transporter ATP-binding protein UgpC [Pseudomonadota bacterium]